MMTFAVSIVLFVLVIFAFVIVTIVGAYYLVCLTSELDVEGMIEKKAKEKARKWKERRK